MPLAIPAKSGAERLRPAQLQEDEEDEELEQLQQQLFAADDEDPALVSALAPCHPHAPLHCFVKRRQARHWQPTAYRLSVRAPRAASHALPCRACQISCLATDQVLHFRYPALPMHTVRRL